MKEMDQDNDCSLKQKSEVFNRYLLVTDKPEPSRLTFVFFIFVAK